MGVLERSVNGEQMLFVLVVLIGVAVMGFVPLALGADRLDALGPTVLLMRLSVLVYANCMLWARGVGWAKYMVAGVGCRWDFWSLWLLSCRRLVSF